MDSSLVEYVSDEESRQHMNILIQAKKEKRFTAEDIEKVEESETDYNA